VPKAEKDLLLLNLRWLVNSFIELVVVESVAAAQTSCHVLLDS
jgi:hypothetical protein